MYRDDLLHRVQERARLQGRNEARRVVEAVLTALGEHVPDRTLHGLLVQLPPELRVVAVAPGGSADPSERACMRFIRTVADRLHVEEPDAAFFARVTFEQLNAHCGGAGPERVAAFAPDDLRPLLTARDQDPAVRPRGLFTTLSGPPSAPVKKPVTAVPLMPAATTAAAVAAHRQLTRRA